MPTKPPSFALIVLLWALAACQAVAPPQASPTPFTGQPRSVIIDTDMAGDDWMAILYLLQRPDVEVKAITVAGTGEAHCEPGVRHALELVALSGHRAIPVACGRETPLQGEHRFPISWCRAVDDLYGLTLPAGSNPAPDQSAIGLLTSLIQASPQKTTVLTLGPLTNLAEALQATPALVDRVEMIYVMGGAVAVPGNVGVSGAGIENAVAEWNIYVDPRAANLVLESSAPITLVPLDATNHALVTTRFYNRLKGNHVSPEAGFIFDVLSQQKDFIESGGYYFWDPLAAAILTDESLATIETRRLAVSEGEGPESGWTRPAEDGASVRVAVSADGGRFEQMFLDALNAP